METTYQTQHVNQDKNTRSNAVFIHLSGFLKLVFPLLFIIIPIIIWTRNKENSFVDKHGRQAINFHISMMIYSLLIIGLFIVWGVFSLADLMAFGELIDKYNDDSLFYFRWAPWMIWLILLTLLSIAKFFFEIIVMLIATIRASDGKLYRYPLSFQFLK